MSKNEEVTLETLKADIMGKNLASLKAHVESADLGTVIGREVKKLLHGEHQPSFTSNATTLFDLAAASQDLNILKYLVEEVRILSYLPEGYNISQRWYSLLAVLNRGTLEIIEYCVDNGYINVNWRDDMMLKNNFALYTAVLILKDRPEASADVFKYLLLRGAKIVGIHNEECDWSFETVYNKFATWVKGGSEDNSVRGTLMKWYEIRGMVEKVLKLDEGISSDDKALIAGVNPEELKEFTASMLHYFPNQEMNPDYPTRLKEFCITHSLGIFPETVFEEKTDTSNLGEEPNSMPIIGEALPTDDSY